MCTQTLSKSLTLILKKKKPRDHYSFVINRINLLLVRIHVHINLQSH
jgi:hypothetical protein